MVRWLNSQTAVNHLTIKQYNQQGFDMAYSDLTQLKKRISEAWIIQLTDDENTGAVNQARVDEAIAKADATIDSKCKARYAVPFNPIPDIISNLSADMAVYNLYARKVEEIPKTRDDINTAAIKQLNDIRDGKDSIGESEADVPEAGGVQTNTSADDRMFTKETLGNF